MNLLQEEIAADLRETEQEMAKEAKAAREIDELDALNAECSHLRARLKKAMTDLDVAHDLLHDCAEELEKYSDVNDGSYGEPRPNRAMSLCTAIDVYFYGIPL